LEAVVNAYNQSRNPGRFKLVTNHDGSFDVVGIGTSLGAKTPILDTKISFTVEDISEAEAVRLWCAEVSRRVGIEVVYLGLADNPLFQSKVSLAAHDAAAREVLPSILAQGNAPRNWRLFYDYDTKKFLLTLR